MNNHRICPRFTICGQGKRTGVLRLNLSVGLLGSLRDSLRGNFNRSVDKGEPMLMQNFCINENSISNRIRVFLGFVIARSEPSLLNLRLPIKPEF